MTSRTSVLRAFVDKERLEVWSRGLLLALHIGLPLLLALAPMGIALALRAQVQDPVPAADGPMHALLALARAVPELASLAPADAVLVLALRHLSLILALAPLVLTVLAGTTSLHGEESERTLEPLLATPVSDAGILFGKLAALGLPAVASTLAAGLAACAIADLALASFVLPDLGLLLVLFVVSPLAAILGVLAAIPVGSPARDLPGRLRAGSFRVLPFAACVLIWPLVSLFKPAVSATWGNWAIAGFALLLALADLVLLRRTLGSFHREEILTGWR